MPGIFNPAAFVVMSIPLGLMAWAALIAMVAL